MDHRPALALALLIAGAAAVAASPARAETCRNQAAEIRCAAGACTVETASFTPMELTISRDRRSVSICAYSGCAEGPVTLARTRGPHRLIHAMVRWRGTAGLERAEPLAMILDARNRSAQLSWRGFAQTMICR